MTEYAVKLVVDSSSVDRALASLAELAERFPEVVQRFLDGLDPRAKLFRIYPKRGFALRAGEVRIVLQPTNRLVHFLSAFGAGNIQPVMIDV